MPKTDLLVKQYAICFRWYYSEFEEDKVERVRAMSPENALQWFFGDIFNMDMDDPADVYFETGPDDVIDVVWSFIQRLASSSPPEYVTWGDGTSLYRFDGIKEDHSTECPTCKGEGRVNTLLK